MLAVVLPSTAEFVRYIAPAIPPLAVGLAVALTATIDFLTDIDPGLVGWVASTGVAAAALAPTVSTSLKFDRLLAAGDTRDVATYWLREHGLGPVAVQGGWFEEVRALGQKSAEQCMAILPAELAPPSPYLVPDPSNWEVPSATGAKGGFIAREATDHYQRLGGGARHEAKYLLVGRGQLASGLPSKLEYSPPFEPECFQLRDIAIIPARSPATRCWTCSTRIMSPTTALTVR